MTNERAGRLGVVAVTAVLVLCATGLVCLAIARMAWEIGRAILS